MKKQENGYVVDGYLFSTEEEAATARKELQGIQYLQKNNNMKDEKVLEQVYEKVLQQGLFRTPVGLNYLKYLQNTIRSRGGENILPIPVNQKGMESKTSIGIRRNMLELDDVGGAYRKKFRISIAVIVVLMICLALMIGVAATTNQPNILNYEEKLINKYEQWEQELQEREEQLKDQGE